MRAFRNYQLIFGRILFVICIIVLKFSFVFFSVLIFARFNFLQCSCLYFIVGRYVIIVFIIFVILRMVVCFFCSRFVVIRSMYFNFFGVSRIVIFCEFMTKFKILICLVFRLFDLFGWMINFNDFKSFQVVSIDFLQFF